MDGRSKKRLSVLQQRLTKLRQQLSGAVKQADDPSETERLRKEIAALEAEIRKLKES